MKPITFENLRRLMGGGRKKKEKESSFKRSDSFKRISIRKSYLDRGKKKNISKLEVATQTVSEVEETPAGTKKVDSSVQVDKEDLCPTTVDFTKNELKCNNNKYKAGTSKNVPEQSVIAYGQWLRGIRKEEAPPASGGGIKGSERTIIYVPASDEAAPPTVIRQLSSSPVLRRKPSPGLQRKESNDSAVEMFPWGDSTEAKKSPLVRRRSRLSPVPLMPDSGTEELCSLSISLGRIWMDAPSGMAPRSLEMPKATAAPQPAHHSLDSALKDPMVMNRLQKRAPPPVGRTLSSTSNTTAFSSKDSGFSFSISAPKLSDFAPSSRGFFRKKQPKPKLSVSRDGYFKRTSGLDKMVDFILNSISYDGGIGQGPDLESHCGSTFCAVASLALSNRLHSLSSAQLASLRRWLLHRFDGGFNGRPNKPIDTCYSFWTGGALKILESYRFIANDGNDQFVLMTQDRYGGFSKWVNAIPDPMHTYLGLAGLSLMDSDGLSEMFCELNVTKRTFDFLRRVQAEWEPVS